MCETKYEEKVTKEETSTVVVLEKEEKFFYFLVMNCNGLTAERNFVVKATLYLHSC